MNLDLSDEQVLLREAARGTLSRFKNLEAAREALDSGGSPPDLWPTAVEAGWPGLLVSEAHGGAGLDAFDAMLVLSECGRVLAAIPLLGHLPATAILDSCAAGAELLPALASGDQRAAYLPARPPRPPRAAPTAARTSPASSRSSPTRPAPTSSSASRCSTASPSASPSRPTPPGSTSIPCAATTPPARSATSRCAMRPPRSSTPRPRHSPERGTWRRR